MLKDYVIVDIETTGLDAAKDKIIEIGAIKCRFGREPEVYNVLINPGVPISERIVEIVGITDEMVKKERTIDSVIGEFVQFTQDLPLLGHNLPFDYGFLKTAAVRHGINFEKMGVDTLAIARRFLADLESRRLDYLCAYFGIREEQHHRAWNDAKVTGELYQILCERFENEDQHAFSPRQLQFSIKKESPITPKQESFLMSLLNRHQITPDYEVKELTKSEASKKIDGILSLYGRG